MSSFFKCLSASASSWWLFCEFHQDWNNQKSVLKPPFLTTPPTKKKPQTNKKNRFPMPLKGYEGEVSTGCQWCTLSHSPLLATCHKCNAAASHLLHPSHPSRHCEQSSFPHWLNGACKKTEKLQLFWVPCAVDGVSIFSSVSFVFSWRKIPRSLSSFLHREAQAYSPAPARVWPAHLSQSTFSSHLKSLKRSLSMVKMLYESHTKESERRQSWLLLFSCRLCLSGER